MQVEPRYDRPPMRVNSKAKVANLNADLVDGKSASDFLPNAVVFMISLLRGEWMFRF